MLNILTITVPVDVACVVTVHDRCLRKARLVNAGVERHKKPSIILWAAAMTLGYVKGSSATSLQSEGE